MTATKIAAFAAASIARSEPMQTGFEAVRLAWSAYLIPFMFVAAPVLLLRGDWVAVSLAVATAACGVCLASAGVTGFMAGPLAPASRVAFGAAGLLLLLPAEATAAGPWTDVAGAALASGLLIWRLARRASPAGRNRRQGTQRGERS